MLFKKKTPTEKIHIYKKHFNFIINFIEEECKGTLMQNFHPWSDLFLHHQKPQQNPPSESI